MKASTLFVALWATTSALAQVVIPPASDPGALQQQRMEEAERQRQFEQLDRPIIRDPLREPAAPSGAVRNVEEGQRFLLREVRFSESEILSVDTLRSIASDYVGREVTIGELMELVERINNAYRTQRVFTSQAVLPPQEVADGVVFIRLVEGRLGVLAIDGHASTRESFIRSRIRLQPGQLVDLPALEEDLIRFNRYQDIQLRAALKPGTAFATSDLDITVEEPSRNVFRVLLDNAGGESTGTWRLGLVYLNRSLLGWRDELSLSTNQAIGQNSYSLGYSFPVNRSGGRLSLAHYRDNIAVKRGPLSTLDLTGESSGTVLSFRQPVHATETLRLDITAGAKRRTTTNWISGVFLQTTRTEDFNLGGDLQMSDTRGIWLMNYNLTSGKAEGQDLDRYLVGRGSVRRFHNLPAGWSIRGGFSFQHARNELLPSSEQMLIGGEFSVRGYPVGTYSGNSGVALNMELHHPVGEWLMTSASTPVTSTGFFFIDHGRVQPFRPPGGTLPSTETITGVGWGVQTQIGQHVTARLTLAQSLDRVQNQSSRNQVHFQLTATYP